MSSSTLDRINKCLAEVLALDPSTIRPNSSLMNELGADSLDLVELMFVLEQEFGVRLTQEDLRLTHQLGLAESEIHREEVLTPLALERLREKFPETPELFVEGLTRRHLGVLLNPLQIAQSIEAKLVPTASASTPEA